MHIPTQPYEVGEGRIRFNERIREHLGSWATKDVSSYQKIVMGILFSEIGTLMGGAVAAAMINPIDPRPCMLFGGALGTCYGYLQCAALFDRRKRWAEENEEKYQRLVGQENTEKGIEFLLQN